PRSGPNRAPTPRPSIDVIRLRQWLCLPDPRNHCGDPRWPGCRRRQPEVVSGDAEPADRTIDLVRRRTYGGRVSAGHDRGTTPDLRVRGTTHLRALLRQGSEPHTTRLANVDKDQAIRVVV